MSTFPLADLLTGIRAELSDDGSDHLVIDGQPSGPQDGVNQRFTLGHHPVSATGFEVRVNNVLKTVVTHYTLDSTRGILQFTAGNEPVDTSILRATYVWLQYPDDLYYEWIASAGGFFGLAASGATPILRAQSVLTNIGDQYLNTLRAYVDHLYNLRRATDWAAKFSSSTAGGISDGGDEVGNKFRELARDALTKATMLRGDAITAFGQRKEVAAGISTIAVPRGAPRR